MFKSMILGLAMAGTTATSGWAQCNACANGATSGTVVASTPTESMAVAAPVQTYQRFSYAPSETTVAPIVSSSVPMMQYNPAPVVRSTNVQNYRRFSYQPTTRSNTSRKPAYLYPKTDPRRYQHQ